MVGLVKYSCNSYFADISTICASIPYESDQATSCVPTGRTSGIGQRDKHEKEAAVQKAAIRMFGAFGSILVRVAVVCFIPVGFVIIGAELGFYTNDEFEHFFRQHIRKIITLRSSSDNRKVRRRYISKNNANISRLELLTHIFPDCKIIIPVRNPWDHISSLLRQHERFTVVHRENVFSRRYMEWLGHFEFGANLRPIDFQQWVNKDITLNPDGNDFWLNYWAVTYEASLAASGSNVFFIDYDRLCTDPELVLRELAKVLDIEDAAALVAQASRIHRPTNYADYSKSVTEALDIRVRQTYDALKERSI